MKIIEEKEKIISIIQDYGVKMKEFCETTRRIWKLIEEVEIIEEEKEIEKLDKVDGSKLVDLHKNSTCKEQNEAITNLIMYLNNNIVKINELIDAVNGIRKEK